MRYQCGLTMLLLLAPLAGGEEQFFRPANDTFVKNGPVSVIAKGAGELRLDGKPVKSERPVADVVTANVTPGAGAHTLSLGSTTIRFWVGQPTDPVYKEFKPHPPVASCDACHVVKDGEWQIKGGSAGENCLGCHDRAAFPKIHQHNPEVLQDCQLCHFPHGSAAKSHLRVLKAAACKQCHG
jgi:predicted CXXCH cytochrome family protein